MGDKWTPLRMIRVIPDNQMFLLIGDRLADEFSDGDDTAQKTEECSHAYHDAIERYVYLDEL